VRGYGPTIYADEQLFYAIRPSQHPLKNEGLLFSSKAYIKEPSGVY